MITTSPSRSDEELQRPDDLLPLMTGVAAGHTQALTELYDRTCRQVYRVAFAILRRADEAEEVVLDVFAQVWRTASSFQPSRGRVEAWLSMIARSRALDRLRTRQARPDLDANRAAVGDAGTAIDARGFAEIVAVDARCHATSVLQLLTTGERRLIELAFFEGYTHGELSELLDIPLGTIKTRIRKSLIKMRRPLLSRRPLTRVAA